MARFVAAMLATMLMATGAAAPVQAQGLFFGDERSDFMRRPLICLTDSQIRGAVAENGYSSIYLNVPNDQHIQVRATKGGWVYLLDFNYCTGQIEGRQRLRQAG